MSGAGKGFAWFSGTFFFLVLLKDGTIGSLIDDGARFLKDGAKGIRPITRVG